MATATAARIRRALSTSLDNPVVVTISIARSGDGTPTGIIVSTSSSDGAPHVTRKGSPTYPHSPRHEVHWVATLEGGETVDLIPKVKPGEVFDWTACHMDAGHPQINSGPADCPPPASGKSRAWKYSIVVNKGQDLRELSLDPVIIIEE